MLRTMVTSRYLGTSTYVQPNSTVLRQVYNVALGCLASGRTGDSSTVTNLRLLPFGRILIGLLETSSLLGSGGIAGFVVNVVGRESAAVLVAGASPPLAVAVLAVMEKEDSASLLGTGGELVASSLTLHVHVACKGIGALAPPQRQLSRHSISYSSAILALSSCSFLALAALLL